MGWFCKLTGIALILMAAVLTGMELELELKRKWFFLREMTEAVRFLEKEMGYHRTPVQEALREAAKRCQAGPEKLFARAAELVEARTGNAFREIWEEAATDSISGCLTAQQEQTVRELSAALCSTDTVIQKTLLEKYRERFELMSREMEQQYREKGALYRRLSAAAGAFLALLLM